MNKKTFLKIFITLFILLAFVLLVSTYFVSAATEPGKVTGAKVVLRVDAKVKVPYFSWNAVSDATEYEIWRGDTEPERILTTVNTNYFAGGENHLLDPWVPYNNYWVRAINDYGEGEFSDAFTYFIKPATPKNLKATKTNQGIKLTWDKVSGAESYNIYLCGRTPGTNEMYSYNIDSTISNFITINYTIDSNEMYAVKAVTTYPGYYDDKEMYSDISNYATYRANVPTPSGVKANVQNGKVTLSWNAVEDADGYQIYNGNTYIKTTSSLNYTLSNLSTSKVHTLKVRAYIDNDFYNPSTKFYSNFSNVNVFPNAVSKAKTSLVGKTNIKITWNKKSNVTGYKIYRSTSKNSGYKNIKTITSKNTNSYTDKNLSKGKTYYYKVIPYLKTNGKEYNGGNSNISNIKTFSDSKITGLYICTEAGSSNSYLSWTKSSNNIDGYIIYRATSKNGKYKKVKTITSSKTYTYTNKNLSKGKTYYYKVRGYKKINGKTYYTKYSNIKSIKTSYINKNTSLPHQTYTYYGDAFTIKTLSMKYKKNSGSKAIYQIKMKIKAESSRTNDVYFTVYFYDKNNRYIDSTTLQFGRKVGNYTKTITWENVKIPKKAASFTIK